MSSGRGGEYASDRIIIASVQLLALVENEIQMTRAPARGDRRIPRCLIIDRILIRQVVRSLSPEFIDHQVVKLECRWLMHHERCMNHDEPEGRTVLYLFNCTAFGTVIIRPGVGGAATYSIRAQSSMLVTDNLN